MAVVSLGSFETINQGSLTVHYQLSRESTEHPKETFTWDASTLVSGEFPVSYSYWFDDADTWITPPHLPVLLLIGHEVAGTVELIRVRSLDEGLISVELLGVVPEPSALTLCVGLVFVLFFRRIRSRARGLTEKWYRASSPGCRRRADQA
jgi:hypothetical protein